jgi:uncharacterized protein YecE (DUF72 family)
MRGKGKAKDTMVDRLKSADAVDRLAGRVRVGTCGFAMRRQQYYRTFPVVEIQQTFYKLPRVTTAARWRAEAPSGFEFTMKAWQLITHEPSSPTYRRLSKPIPSELRDRYGAFRPTDEVFAAWAQTRAVADALGAAIVVFQCPPSFTATPEHLRYLRAFFTTIDRAGWLAAWEPRGEWAPDVVRALCRELSLVHVVDPLKEPPQHGAIRYYRLHGVTGYRYVHTDEDLERLQTLCGERRSTYCLFNNLFMAEDALRFRTLLESRRRAVAGRAGRTAR